MLLHEHIQSSPSLLPLHEVLQCSRVAQAPRRAAPFESPGTSTSGPLRNSFIVLDEASAHVVRHSDVATPLGVPKDVHAIAPAPDIFSTSTVGSDLGKQKDLPFGRSSLKLVAGLPADAG